MIDCIIVDDNSLDALLVEDYIYKTPGIELKQSFDNATDALAYLDLREIDLIFLKMSISDLSSAEFLFRLKGDPCIIIMQDSSEFTDFGSRYKIIEILEKPISYADFLNAVSNAQKNKVLGHGPVKRSEKKFLFVRTEYKHIKLNIADIIYIEAMKSYSKIYTIHGIKPILTLQNIKSFEDKLCGEDFIRVHRSYLISIPHIHSVQKNSVMMGTHEIPVSDSFKGLLNQLIDRYS